ncbi:hypothetical protein HXX76_008684 [Chlamydomonas incerta]|uniref:L-ornithine N(5)-monooxygenase n=1 Tax=Chlamydomonas incerta TaxID=51695 RepID=A0A835W1T1_CHLIN|nr:hypothetical protein HXX76_008684 [Chlamydomonas incerta]|eukprot:KAG2432956.1 hypothetical protein HXX76_008684 [Chlamydomonas incerta]
MYELLIVGSGPAALSVLCRLIEEDPDDSVDGHRREVKPKAALQRAQQHQAGCGPRRDRLAGWLRDRVLIVDERGGWMSRWDEQFAGLGIAHLRSPSSVHPDPSSSYSLEMWAEQRRRCCELRPMEVMEKSADFRGPFDLPGTALFRDFVGSVLRRYCLDSPGAVLQLTPVPCTGAAASTAGATGSNSTSATGTSYSHCVATLSDGSRVAARRVLLAVGSTNVPRLPPFAQGWVVAAAAAGPAPSSTATATATVTGSAAAEVGAVAGAAPAAAAVDELQQLQPNACHDQCKRPHQQLHPFKVLDESLAPPAPDADTQPAQQQTQHPAAEAQRESAAVATAEAVEAAAPPPWAGRMLHAWDVARSFSCRKPRQAHSDAAVSDCGAAAVATSGGTGCGSGGGGSSCRSLAGQRVVVVGGGLTAAQLVALAAQHGSEDVVLLVRRKLKQVKQFDVDVPWLGRMRQAHLHDFGRLPGGAEARLAALRAAVGGGSATPEAVAALRALQAKGMLRIEEEVEVEAADWSECCCVPPGGGVPPGVGRSSCGFSNGGIDCSSDSENECSQRSSASGLSSCGSIARGAAAGCTRGYGSLPWSPHRAAGCWHLYLSRPLERRRQRPTHDSDNEAEAACGSDGDDGSEGGLLLHADHVWCATGSVVDAGRDPLLRGLQAQCPVELHGGLPELTPELRWCEGLDVFVAGAYAALRLGPGAGNLMGARTAAVRLVRLWQREAGADLCPYIKPRPQPQPGQQSAPGYGRAAASSAATQEPDGDAAPAGTAGTLAVSSKVTAASATQQRAGQAVATSRRRPKGRQAGGAPQGAVARAPTPAAAVAMHGPQSAGVGAPGEAGSGDGGAQSNTAEVDAAAERPTSCEQLQALCYCDAIVRHCAIGTSAA